MPVYLNRLLAINMATLAALGTLLLGMAQENMLLPLVMLLAAASSVLLNDITGRFRLGRRIANMGMLVALYVSIVLVFGPGRADLAIYLANLLAYIQIILLFVEKDTRVWWHLALLSLIQVCVAAAYSQEMVFGGLMVAYLFLGLSTMVLIFLSHERTHYRRASHVPTFAGFSVISAVREKQDWGRLAKIALITSVTGPLSLLLTYGESSTKVRPAVRPPAPDPGSGRWPLAGQVSTFTSSAAGAGGSAGFGWELWFRLVGMTAWTLLLASLVFAVVPRLGFRMPFSGYRDWEGEGLVVRRTVGFDDNVKLGDLGFVIQDPDKVLGIKLVDHATADPYPVNGEIYLRGAVLTQYEDGNWRYDYPTRISRSAIRILEDLPSTDGLVRQEIDLEPMDREEVFCVWPLVFLPDTREVAFDPWKERILGPPLTRSRRFAFRLGTTAFVGGKQVELTPTGFDVVADHLLGIQDDLPSLVEQARTWIDESGMAESDPIARAQVLESQFRDSGGFQYKLGGIDRDAGVDPIEDFIANNRIGHCEYFSTALTLMLRSQGIPARMIVGYKSDDYDASDSSFEVRQWDAHTWVEAYISPDQIRALDELPGPPVRDWRQGGWLRLDPTPAAPELTGIAALFKGVQNWRDLIETVWKEYVIGMDGGRQRELVYDPLAAALKSGAGCLVDPDWWRGLFRGLARLPGWLRESFAGGRWFSWRGGLVAIILVAISYATYRAVRLAARLVWVRLIGRAVGRIRRRRARIKFYRRLEVVMKRHGLNRLPSQTHREFAAEARRRMAQSAEVGHLASLPGEITEAFYDVRFGGAALDNQRAQAVEQALGRLEKSDGW
jgi:protein-glutamine gamma-glutamyltransferase